MNKKTLIRCIAFLLASLMLCFSFVSCASKSMIELGDVEISENIYEFLLSRMKGTLYNMGYSVNSDSFWNTVFSINGMTYGEFFKTRVLEQAYSYAVSEFLFDKEGLELPSESLDAIDTLMDKLVEKAGSKNKLNSELSAFGVNYSMLKEIYTIEAKMEYLKAYYYGEDGEKISKEDKDKYYEENYVCFKQILLAGYYYEYELDKNGDGIYYTSDKAERIAYDKENGKTKLDVTGKNVVDTFGDDVYYTDDGKIAYDKKNGVLKYLLDKDGEKIFAMYGKEEMAQLKEEADSIVSMKLDKEGFERILSNYESSDNDGKLMYLLNSPSYYGSQATGAGYLDDIAAALGEMKVGETKVITSDFGYHIIYKYENENEAYLDEQYKDVFDSFNSDIIEEKFSEKCDEYENKVDLNDKVWKDAPDIADVGINTLY